MKGIQPKWEVKACVLLFRQAHKEQLFSQRSNVSCALSSRFPHNLHKQQAHHVHQCKKKVFCDFQLARATLCRDRRGRCRKTEGFLRFLPCTRDPLRGWAWSRCENSRVFAISAVPARPSGWIMNVGSLSLWPRANLRGSRASLCGDCAGQIALAVVPCESSRSARNRLQGSGCKVATFQCKSSTRSTSLQLWLQSRNF